MFGAASSTSGTPKGRKGCFCLHQIHACEGGEGSATRLLSEMLRGTRRPFTDEVGLLPLGDCMQ